MPELSLTSQEVQAHLRLELRRRRDRRRRSFIESDYFNEPARFCRECINWPEGKQLLPYQGQVMDTLQRDRRLAVRGPRGLGKTTMASLLVWWFALTRSMAGIPWKIATTSGSNRQLVEFFWPEIAKTSRWIKWDKIGRGPLVKDELVTKRLTLPYGHAFGASAKDSNLIEGLHEDQVLVIWDESKAIPDSIFNAFQGSLSTGNIFALAISTPGDPVGWFYDIHRRKPHLKSWTSMHITLDEALSAGQITQQWVDVCREMWGEDSPLFQAHAKGEFSTKSSSRQIPLLWVEQAVERWYEWKEQVRSLLGYDAEWPLNIRDLRKDEREALAEADLMGNLDAIGSDVAGGGRDNSLLAPRYGRIVPEIEICSSDTMELAGRISSRIKSENPEAIAIPDIQTVGKGLGHRLRELGINLIPFNGGKSTKFKNLSGDIECADTRTAAWLNVWDLLNPVNGYDVILPDFEIPEQRLSLAGDLTAPKFSYNSSGKLKLESKNSDSDDGEGGRTRSLRARLGRSTDAGDTVVNSFWPGEPGEDPESWWIGAGDGEAAMTVS